MVRPAKPLINRHTVVETAIEIIDSDGLDAFSLPRLAAHLGVRAPSLYHHFTSKNEILLSVVRHVAGSSLAPCEMSPGPHWPGYFVMLAANFRHSILRYRNIAPLLLLYPPRDLIPEGYEQATAFLRESGVPAALHIKIIDGVETLSVGAVLSEAIEAVQRHPVGFGGVDPVREPLLSSALRACSLSSDDLFEEKIRGFLRGVTLTERLQAVV